jgi:hypothetical protein
MIISYAIISLTQSHVCVDKGDEQIKHDIEEFLEDDDIIKFHKLNTSNDDFVQIIANNIGKSIEAVKIFVGNNFYQAIFVGMPNVNVKNIEMKSINMLGTQITGGIYCISPVAIFKYKIKLDTEIEFDNLTHSDVVSILNDRFFHNGVLIKSDNTIESYIYQQHMLDNVMYKYGIEFVQNNFQTDEIELGDMIFKIAYNKNDKIINKELTKIIGQNVYGDVFCNLYYKEDHNKEPNFISINKEQCLKIIKILSNPKFDSSDYYTNITPENSSEVSNKDVSQIVVSPYTTIDRMYNTLNKIK